MSRICQKTIELAAEEGIKIGLLRPITLWPFPTEAIARQAAHVKGILSAELNAGQMVEDVRLAVNGKVTGRALRPPGRYRSHARRSSGRPERETNVNTRT